MKNAQGEKKTIKKCRKEKRGTAAEIDPEWDKAAKGGSARKWHKAAVKIGSGKGKIASGKRRKAAENAARTRREVREFLSFLKDKKIPLFSASLAFYLLLGVVPLLFVIVRLFSFFGFPFRPSLVPLPVGTEGMIDELLKETNVSSVSAGVLFFFTNLYSSSVCFYYLGKIGEEVYGKREKRGTVILRVLSFAAVFLLWLIVLFSAGIGVALNSVFAAGAVASVVSAFVSVCASVVVLFAVHRLACPFRAEIRDLFVGVAFTFAFWVVFTVGFTLYLSFFPAYDRLYGKLAAAIVFLVWLYAVTRGLVFGIVLNVYVREKKESELGSSYPEKAQEQHKGRIIGL